MAQVECITTINNEKCNDDDGCTPSKKLKQARLPFKTIDQKTQLISPKSSSASKKRKLSDAESPSAKAPKTPKSGTTTGNVPDTIQIVSNETEVSSSSEADSVKTRVRNTLERFVRKSLHEEITSSTNNDCIDLTDSEDGKESDLSFVDLNTCQSKKIKEFFSVKETSKKNDKKKDPESENPSVATTSSKTTEQVEISLESDSLNDSLDNKENMDVSIESDSGNTVESNPNNSASDPVTPGKINLPSTVLHTPSSSKKSPQSMTTPLSQSPGDSLSDGTPKSGKKPRPKLSEAKQKERDALRQKLKEEKQKALDDKKKQKEQERLQKEKEKEKLRLEKEAVKAEKERQKKEEKEKREKERLEKLQQKEEEQKKKREELEAKQEEKKKKEEEKKLKEEEKQKENEEKMKKEQKVKEAFQSFFIKTNISPTSSKSTKEPSGLFMPFQVKKDTRLAPEHRKSFCDDAKTKLDTSVNDQNCGVLYLSELKNGKKVGKSGKTYPKVLGDDDVELMVHDSEVVKKVTYRCKLLQFHMNYRPPYYGTWRKKSQTINPRNPLKTDTDLLDYEYDSDDDWEEEEPGESLSDCEDDDEKDEDGKDEEGDGWMVPHGYLSDDEGVDDDEEVTPEVLKMRRDAKAEQWESELKRQTKPALPQIIGCFWEQAAHVLQEEISYQLEQYKAVLLIPGPIPTSFNEPVKPVKGDNGKLVKGENGIIETTMDTPKVNPQRKPVPEEAMPDLIRLVHGNLMGIKKLIHEFRLFWKSKTSGEEVSNIADVSMEVDDSDVKTCSSQDSVNNKSINLENDALEADCAISKRQLEMKISAIAIREKRADFKKICWYVHEEILKQYNCEGLPIPSAWESLTLPTKTPAKVKSEEVASTTPGRKTPVPSITQFVRPMSPSTIAAQHAAAQAKLLAAQAEKKKELEAAVAEQKVEEKMDISETPHNTSIPQKKELADQRKLTEFTNVISTPKQNMRRIIPIKVSEVTSESVPIKPVARSTTAKVKEDNALNVKPLDKLAPATTINGLVDEPIGDNSQNAIVLD